jgi:photosystem II stability/assembly factor-like uncharacterized protein
VVVISTPSRFLQSTSNRNFAHPVTPPRVPSAVTRTYSSECSLTVSPVLRRLAAAIALAVAVPLAVSGGPGSTSAAAVCPPGYRPVGAARGGTASGADEKRLLDAVDGATVPTGSCVSVKAPETAAELSLMAREEGMRRSAPFDTVREGAYTAALAQRRTIAQAAPIAGTDGTWTPVGTTPLIGKDENNPYPEVDGLGLRDQAGRIQDFSWDAANEVLYASVAGGGVYKTKDLGETWVDVSATLPNLTVGSVAYSPANGGTLVVITGDSNGGGNSLKGTGAYWSNNDGATWTKSAGVPDGMLGFRAVFDPTSPLEVYVATGGGLFRSLDAGKTFANVNLPTGACAGQPAVHPCFFANQVTDVVIQSPDEFENAGGRVVAAVGWRAGMLNDRDGHPQAEGNGLYGSDSGDPDSFERIDQPGDGFASQAEIGRTELGTTEGSDQNHDYLYAIVQDAVKFNGGVPVTDANDGTGAVVYGYNNVLNGIYVSGDFGDTWTLMANGEQLAQSAVANGSSLSGIGGALGFAPGVQAWYNEFIRPDPTRTDALTGAPTRLLFGLEEVWANEATTVPQVGPSAFHVIGRYFSDEQCGILVLGRPEGVPCETDRLNPSETTTHPDQHGIIFLPGEDEGSVHLFIGNDGGVYRQSVGVGEEFVQTGWGDGMQDGFHTLLPYGVAVAKDGVIWSGLQDNGHMKITTDGRQYSTYGGDGTWALVDPNDSNVAYEATPNAAMSFTTDGGVSWNSMSPGVTNSMFVTQFEMDPLDPDHLIVSGTEVMEKLDGATGSGWTEVFNLGANGEFPNRGTAVDVIGNASYVSFCGQCDVVTGLGEFASGIATNVGGEEPGEAGSTAGWHVAEAAGLPERFVNSVVIDPDDPSTVYVALGGYGRRWVPPGANGDAAENVGEGHVYKSTDAGATFTDISGNLPDVPANFLVVRGGQILAGTDFGVFAAPTRNGGTWGLLGDEYELPLAPIVHMVLKPGDPNTMIVSTFGRGIYSYSFADPAPVGPAPSNPPAPITPPPPLPSTGSGALPAALGLLMLVASGWVMRRRLRGEAV